ncbi:MAG: glycosyltransferase family 1 protein [Acidobacteria bacterium]|nr:MAG: glycosyltransferase family 1 protein [Acidobacteriota bacterium]
MKVLLVHNEYQQPGGEDIVFRLERQLLSSFGHRVLTYMRSNQEIKCYSNLQKLLLIRQMIWAKDSQRDIARIIKLEKPDVVHVHNTFTQISPSIYAECRRAGVPVVQTLHNFRLLCPGATFYRSGRICDECVTHSLGRSILYGCYRNSRFATAAVATMLAAHRALQTWSQNITSYIALTEFARQQFIRGGLPPGKIHVKPNFAAPDPGRGTHGGGFAIFVGRLSPEKGLQTLLHAWRRLRNTIPLHIVGDGPLREELTKYVKQQGLSSVRFMGRLGREETQEAIKAARFLILPSVCFENFPMTIVEAFAAGTPVICSRLGAMREIVAHRHTGLHFDPTSVEQLSDTVAWGWEHIARMQAMGRAARHEFELKYTAEKNYSLLMDIYRQALENPPREEHRGDQENELLAAPSARSRSACTC